MPPSVCREQSSKGLIWCLFWLGCAAAALAAPRARADDNDAETLEADAPKVARPDDFPRRSEPRDDAERHFNLKESRLTDFGGGAPIKPLPAEFKGIVTPPDEDTATKFIKSPRDAASPIDVLVNRVLTDAETNKALSTVCSPTVAVRGDEVLVTGNWFAAFSGDGGKTFKFIDPGQTFEAPPGQQFAGGQVALYDARNDVMFWLLPYAGGGETNTLRLAVAHGDDIAKEVWRYYDLDARKLLGPTDPRGRGGVALDFGDLAVGEKHLYLTANLFNVKENKFLSGLVYRVPLEQLAAYKGYNARYYSTPGLGSWRATQGAAGTMHFATHLNPQTIVVGAWPEAQENGRFFKVNVDAWRLPERGRYEAPGPDGRNWLNRADPRITAAWAGKDVIGFAWTVPQDDNFPFPHVRCAILDAQTKKVVAQPHLWTKDFAVAYPAAAPNADGTAGISVCLGGGKTLYPSHAVGVLRPVENKPEWKWELVTTALGTHGPEKNTWGDYLAVRPHPKDPASWVATGFALKDGTDRSNVQVRYLHFRPHKE